MAHIPAGLKMGILRTASQSRSGFTEKLSPLYHLRAENMVSINFAISIIVVYKFVGNKSSFR